MKIEKNGILFYKSLQMLLKSDEESYKSQIINQQETKEEKLENMRNRVIELKKKHESERKQIADKQLYRHWRDNCVEFREVDSTLKITEITNTNKQIIEGNKIKKVNEEKGELIII